MFSVVNYKKSSETNNSLIGRTIRGHSGTDNRTRHRPLGGFPRYLSTEYTGY